MQGLQSSALLNSEFNSSDLWHACSDLLTSKHEGGPKIGRESHVRQLRVRRLVAFVELGPTRFGLVQPGLRTLEVFRNLPRMRFA